MELVSWNRFSVGTGSLFPPLIEAQCESHHGFLPDQKDTDDIHSSSAVSRLPHKLHLERKTSLAKLQIQGWAIWPKNKISAFFKPNQLSILNYLFSINDTFVCFLYFCKFGYYLKNNKKLNLANSTHTFFSACCHVDILLFQNVFFPQIIDFLNHKFELCLKMYLSPSSNMYTCIICKCTKY